MIPTNCSTARRQPAPWFCWSWAVDCPCARLEIFDFFFYIGSIIRRLNSTVVLVSGSELTGVQCEQEGGWAHSPGDFRCWALKLEEVGLPLRTVCGLLVRKSDIQLQSVRLKLWVLKFPFVRNADFWVWFPTRHEYWGFRIGGRVGVSIWQVGNDTQKPTLLTNITLKTETHQANCWPSEASGATRMSSAQNLFGVFSCVGSFRSCADVQHVLAARQSGVFSATFLPDGSDERQRSGRKVNS